MNRITGLVITGHAITGLVGVITSSDASQNTTSHYMYYYVRRIFRNWCAEFFRIQLKMSELKLTETVTEVFSCVMATFKLLLVVCIFTAG